MNISAIPPPLEQDAQELRQVLLRLHHYAEQQVQRLDPNARYAASIMAHISDLQALITAVEQYEQAALACLPPVPVDVLALTSAELLAYRESDPLYRLGYVRGYERGSRHRQQTHERALRFYAQHAVLPEPTYASALVQRVRLLLEFHQNPTTVSAPRLDSLRQQLAGITYSHYQTPS